MRQLFGSSRLTAPLIVLLTLVQLLLSVLLTKVDTWVYWTVALSVGVINAHAIWVLIHDCSHGLGHRGFRANRLLSVLGNLAHGIPSAESFRLFHLHHHKSQGRYDLDADVPSAWEMRVFGTAPGPKLAWLAAYPVLLALRALRVSKQGKVDLFDRWVVINIVAVLLFDLAWGALFGLRAVGFLSLCFYCALGPSYFGIRWVQEHFEVFPGQETNSYTGPLNLLMFNVGLHTEHNDFPAVPWSKLPRVRCAAKEFYPDEVSLPSYAQLGRRFLFDRELSLENRILRLSARESS